jgi:CFEM domain-containing protein
MYFSRSTIASFAIYFLLPWTHLINVQAGSPPSISLRDDTPVNLTGIPQCAAATCLNATALTPAKLGCDGTTLTKTCFCETAITPLSCAPYGPSDKDPCWDEMEAWFASICGENASKLLLNGLPTCAQSCAREYIMEMECQSLTRNCFCELNNGILNKAVGCCVINNCPMHMVRGFASDAWRDVMCQYGSTPDFDYGQWDAYKKKMTAIQIGVSIPLGLIGLAFLGCALGAESICGACLIMFAWCVAAIPIMISIFYLPEKTGACKFPF